jgi:mRNA interferase RelE/StbE
MFEILYHDEVVKRDIPKIGVGWQKKIRIAIETKLMTQPEVYGKPLRRSLKGYRKLRVGDYRVIFRIEGQRVKIFVIQHRSKVYSGVSKRA